MYSALIISKFLFLYFAIRYGVVCGLVLSKRVRMDDLSLSISMMSFGLAGFITMQFLL